MPSATSWPWSALSTSWPPRLYWTMVWENTSPTYSVFPESSRPLGDTGKVLSPSSRSRAVARTAWISRIAPLPAPDKAASALSPPGDPGRRADRGQHRPTPSAGRKTARFFPPSTWAWASAPDSCRTSLSSAAAPQSFSGRMGSFDASVFLNPRGGPPQAPLGPQGASSQWTKAGNSRFLCFWPRLTGEAL